MDKVKSGHKTRAPKDQIEGYGNDGITKFKSDTLNSPLPYHFPEKKFLDDHTFEPFKDVSRGKATEKR